MTKRKLLPKLLFSRALQFFRFSHCMSFSKLGPNSKVNFFSGNRNDLINTLLSNISKFHLRADERAQFPISFNEQ